MIFVMHSCDSTFDAITSKKQVAPHNTGLPLTKQLGKIS